MVSTPDNDNNLEGPMVFIIIGKAYEAKDTEGIDLHILLQALGVYVVQIVAGVLPRLTPWTLTLNLQALVQGSASYYVDSCSVEAGERTCEYLEHVVSSMDAGLYLGAIAAVVSLVALVVYVRRDVG